jgi:hypothetical protein
MKTTSRGGIASPSNSPGRFLDKTDSTSPVSIFSLLLFPVLFQFLPIVSHSQQSLPHEARSSFSKLSPELEKNLRNTLKQNSLKFQLVENKGQSGLPQNVAAYFSTKNETVFIEKDRLRIVVTEPVTNKKAPADNDLAVLNPRVDSKGYRYNSFSIQFKGSGGFSDFEKGNEFATKRNFINTRMGIIHAASYAEITLKNIYPGVDLRLYSQENGQLEFDWIIWPGANVADINMEFTGQKELALNAKGDLQVKLGMGSFQMRLPESYYVTPAGKMAVSARFSLSGKNEVQFRGLGKWLKKYPLVIDPDLLWGTFFDGGDASFDEYLYGLEFNSNNDLLYCIGAVNMQISTVYAAALSTAYDGVVDAPTDGLIYALTKNGQTIQYITYLGGGGADVAIGISLSNSFVYVCGRTASSDFPVTLAANGKFPAFDSVYQGNTDGFIAVLNPQLDDLVYCSYLGGPGADQALTVRAIADSSFYVSLHAEDLLSTSTPDYLLNAADNVFGGGSEAWIGKFTSFHSLNFGTYIGGNNDDLVNDFQVLSNGDVVFTGNTRNITEVNATLPDNGSGQEALFGRIHVPGSGPVSFDIIDKFGGGNNDYGWGIYSLGDSVSVVVGETNSNDFPLGTGPSFENTLNGGYDGFIAKIYNNGSAGYKASFTGGTDDDILVSVRPVVVNNQIALLSFGTTHSSDLATSNFNSGTFYSNNNSGGFDMMFLICDLDLTTKYYLSYIGGSANDYLGKTGAPIGSNHLYYNVADTVLYLGTTTHSFENTQAPSFVGRGLSDTANIGVPVFDETKGNGVNDTHVIVAISTRNLFFVLPVSLLNFESSLLPDCTIQLAWDAVDEENVMEYLVERSTDGRNFESIARLHPGNNHYQFNDRKNPASGNKVYYRIRAGYFDGQKYFSAIHSLQMCDQLPGLINIYPTLTSHYFTISGLDPAMAKRIIVEMLDESGKKIMVRQLPTMYGAQTVFFENNPPRGAYIVSIKNAVTGKVLKTQTVIIHY